MYDMLKESEFLLQRHEELLSKSMSLEYPTISQLEYRGTLETIMRSLKETINELSKRKSDYYDEEKFSKAMGVECTDVIDANMKEDFIEYYTDGSDYPKEISKKDFIKRAKENNVDYELLLSKVSTKERMFARLARFNEFRIRPEDVEYFSNLEDKDLDECYIALKEYFNGEITLNKTKSGMFVVKIITTDGNAIIEFSKHLRVAKEMFVAIALSHEVIFEDKTMDEMEEI